MAQARAIVAELKKYDPQLAAKPRWLVLNKLDMVPPEEREARVRDFVLIQQRLPRHVGQAARLQIVATGIAGTAQQKYAFA